MSNLTAIKNKQIIDALNDFSQTQKELIASCSKKYLSRSRLSDSLRYSSRSRSSDLFLLKIPKSGLINTLQETWEFQKHGSGILFKGNESGKVIDANREIIDHSEAFDSWRLSQYFESLEYSNIIWESSEFLADDDDDLDKLLELLEEEHIVKLVPNRYKLYKLVANQSKSRSSSKLRLMTLARYSSKKVNLNGGNIGDIKFQAKLLINSKQRLESKTGSR
ncbi:MAG: hypothetical protein HC764_19720 [Pleurocapsa sp. CRU_1_2]|nr:hypothetical protein [Pleurocapsa sp. CRU_1_2]